MEEWGWRRRCSPPPRVLAVGRILPFPFPGAVESSSRAFALLDYVITTLIVPPLSREGGRDGGREAIDLLGGIHTKPRDSCARANPLLLSIYIYIFLRIGGRKSTLQICPLFFLNPLNWYHLWRVLFDHP